MFQGANVPWNESSTGAKVFSVDFSLPGMKVQRNEKAWNLFNYAYRVTNYITFQCQTHYKSMPCNHCLSMCHFIHQNVSLYVCYVNE